MSRSEVEPSQKQTNLKSHEADTKPKRSSEEPYLNRGAAKISRSKAEPSQSRFKLETYRVDVTPKRYRSRSEAKPKRAEDEPN